MQPKRPWSRAEIDRFLAQGRVPVRLAMNGASGHPVLVSLWFTHRAGRPGCATQRDARVASLPVRDPRCAFEPAPRTLVRWDHRERMSRD